VVAPLIRTHGVTSLTSLHGKVHVKAFDPSKHWTMDMKITHHPYIPDRPFF
jgi:hypothetical protein